ncbi:hypothetical protein [Steroidobacter sp.]|uniref:hypothetical protein n=1 Tax=Steroidobacter sp. TaxID=1978227 RepID=UPI001A4C896F|nr:hypothetical protein [Steroidobacter sp.]MBL8271607.1 hypothetical protein [Steroidobacter sp.]
MTRANREDMVVLSMGLNTLLASVRQTEAWCRFQGDMALLRRTRLLIRAILITRSKFFASSSAGETNDDVAEALFVAHGLRGAAQQCHEGQAALHERLIGGAEAIERLCSSPFHKR